MCITRTKEAAENQMHHVLTFRCGTVSTVPAVTVLYCTVLYCIRGDCCAQSVMIINDGWAVLCGASLLSCTLHMFQAAPSPVSPAWWGGRASSGTGLVLVVVVLVAR